MRLLKTREMRGKMLLEKKVQSKKNNNNLKKIILISLPKPH